MGRFYFDIMADGRAVVDQDGSELPSLEEARDEALSTLGQIARDSLPGDDCRTFTVDIKDDDHRMVIRASLALRVERFA